MTARPEFTRKYRPDEPVEVGDVVERRMENAAFGTCIVTYLETVEGYPEKLVHLERPHARIHGLTVYVATERWTVYEKQFRETYRVCVTGESGRKDNRAE